MTEYTIPDRIDAIDWNSWKPTEYAVLMFMYDSERLLLIRKKRGLGAGKINAPGGRIDPGETAPEAAIRESTEEVCMTPAYPEKRGELFFQFKDGYRLHGTVFFSDTFTGTPAQTDEADPFWCHIDSIPYHEMWEDDRYWLPLALAKVPFTAFFIFDDDRMVDKKIDVAELPPVAT